MDCDEKQRSNQAERTATADLAIEYARRGWRLLRLGHGAKAPTQNGWQNQQPYDDFQIRSLFGLSPVNIGVLLGEPSGWLIDIDLDHPEAVSLADEYLPPTGAIFGRENKPRSHRLYRVVGEIATHKRRSKVAGMIVELRSDGTQTVFPGSLHPSGELIEWDTFGEPAEITADDLMAAVDRLADAVDEKLGIDSRKKTAPNKSAKNSATTKGILARARKYVDKMPSAIAGIGGHNATYNVACELFRFGLSDSEASRLFDEYNQRCEPPWTDSELEHKLRDARQEVEAAGEFGSRVDDKKEEVGLVHSLATEILIDDHFAQDEAGNLYRFNDGVYKRKGAEFITRTVRRLCADREATKSWSSKLGTETVEYIRLQSPTLWENPHATIINVKNGLLDIRTRALKPHSHEYLSVIQLPVEFDPTATCPATDKFDSQVFPEDAVILSHEIAAVLTSPSVRIQKSILFLGEGGNGKSRKLNQFKAFVGSQNCAAVSLHDLEANRFAAARLFGKLANICPDLPSAHLAGTSRFKAITGGDEITAEFKFKTSFEFKCHARLIFSANHPPRSEDASEAFFDRWLVVPFQGRFRGTATEIPEAELDALLTSPSELSGLLNHAIACIDRLRKTARYSEPESVVEAHREFYATTDPFAVWLEKFTVDDPEAVVAVDRLRIVYGAECEQRGRQRPSQTAFGLAFNRMRPKVERKQRTLNGKLQWCYIGICLTSDLSSDSQTSQGSQGYPSLYHAGAMGNESEEESRSKSGKHKEVKPCEPCEPCEPDDNGDCSHTWLDSAENDGRTRRFCSTCYKFGGFVLADGSVTMELPQGATSPQEI